MAGLDGLGPILLVGCGNMAGAMLARWLGAGLDPATVTAVSPSRRALPAGVAVLERLPPDMPPQAIVMLGVKPQKLDDVAPALAPLLGEETILLSILAGTEIASLRTRFPAPRAIVRAMPNTPVAIGRGVVALRGEGLDDQRRVMVARLMAPLGLVEWLDDDRVFDLVTALSGSGPAFLFRFVDALAAAGAELGLDPAQSARMALATVAGAGALAQGAAEPPGLLADRVASPGGSTRKGLDVLDAALPALLRDMLAASERRNRELAAATR